MKEWGIRHQILILALAPTLIVALILGGYFTRTRFHDLEQSFYERSNVIALKFASVSEEGVFTKKNKAILRNLARTTLKEQDVLSIAFYSPEGLEIAASGQQPATPFTIPGHTDISVQKGNASLTVTVPVIPYQAYQEDDLSKTDIIGWLRLEFDNASILLRKYSILINTGLILALGLGISVFLALQMSQKLTRPLIELTHAVKRIRVGDFKTRIRSSRYPELHALEAGIHALAETLQNAQAELQQTLDQAADDFENLKHSLETLEQHNLELDRSRQAAERAGQIKIELLADMSDAICIPLNAVVGFINLLQKTKLDETQKKYLNTLQRSSSALLSILNDILDFAKIEAGKRCIEPVLIDVRQHIETVLNELVPKAHKKSLSLIPLFYSDIPATALGDPLRIQQVITHLVDNAIRLTEKGSIIVRTTLEKKYQNHALIRINVITDLGLSSVEQQELLEAFNQMKTGTSDQFAGASLDRITSKGLVKQMNGEMGLQNEEERGSIFWFTFEVETPEVETPKPEPAKNANLASPNPIPAPFTEDLQILAVDDNPENLYFIALLLQWFGVHVSIAFSAQEAFDLIKTNSIRFNLILMSIRMPHMNGIETIQAIRNYEIEQNLAPIPIIAVTAHAFISEREPLLSAGIDDCLTKPIEEKTLDKLIQKWTGAVEWSPPPSSQLKSIDWDLGAKLVGGKPDLARELIRKLMEMLPGDQRACEQALLTRDWEKLRYLVHRLHGACCYCGVPKLRYAIEKLEAALNTGNLSIIEVQMDILHQAINALLQEDVPA